MGILDEIGLKFSTDKSSLYHDYLKKYEKYLPFDRRDKIRILEIGVFNGASLKTWAEYFYNSQVIGLDINQECKALEEGPINIEIGSQSDVNFINWIFEKYKNFDLVIDDGSHLNEDVIFSFSKIFPRLNPGGIYIVEDTCTSYWEEYGGGLMKDSSMIEYFKKRIDESNFFGAKIKNSDIGYHLRKDFNLIEQFKTEKNYLLGMEIESINFLNSMIIITKR
jgi:SAM-dependent methyltransferase